ncbi:hypothetical protein DF19_40715 [Streptomyces olindensis]|nr:hypothetical protein DF19_40715 [Streptomyces olindensis]
MSEILSYLAAALPADVSAGARLLALQCALRMNAYLHVELRAGLLRSLRIDAVHACQELEQARWASMVNGPGAVGVAAELRDATLLAQSPARPDRRRAADWALRTVARSDPSSGEGLSECDRIIRDCGLRDQGFYGVLSSLTANGVLEGWRICPDSGDVHWTLARGR